MNGNSIPVRGLSDQASNIRTHLQRHDSADETPTNVFIDGFRNEDAQAELFRFLNRALPFTYLSAVVMQELAAGACKC